MYANSYKESVFDAWQQRFGTEPPPDAEQIHPLLLHRSVRSFSDRPVPEELVRSLIGAAQSASTSSNLQLWSVITVQEPDRRAAIAKLCAGQSQVTEAPWFFAFIADHHRLKTAATKVGESSLGLSYVEYLLMAIVDASLAAERMVCAAESLGLGCCYIGALRDKPAEIKSLFGLPARTMGVFGLCLGYPNLPVESYIRPRLDPETVWFKERYSFEVDIAGFESRMSEFYEREQMQGDYRWAKRSGRRVDRNHLTGREVLKEWLAAQGMGTE